MVRQIDISGYIETKFSANTDALIQPEFLVNEISEALGLSSQLIIPEITNKHINKRLVEEESALQ